MELSDHQRFAEIVQMSKSGAWTEFYTLVTTWATEAYEKMLDCKYADPVIRSHFLRRYEERIGLKREIDAWVKSAENGFTEITEQMRRDLEEANRSQSEWLEGVEYQR